MTAPDPNSPGDTTPQDGKTADGNGNGSGSGPDAELTPEALRAELKRARDEAARYRQRAREFADDETYKRAKDAVAALDKVEQEKKSETERLSEEKEKLLHRAGSAEQDLLKLRVALGQGIDSNQADEFASRLRGDTEEDLKKDAEQLAKFFSSPTSSTTPTRRADPSQGRGADAPSGAVDPIQQSLIDKLGIAT